MRIAVIGVGSIGSHYADYLRRAGHTTVTVDPRGTSDFGDVVEIPRSLASDIDAWIVSTPTETHLHVLRRIVRASPNARVLLEKPAALPAAIPDLAREIRENPGTRILVNNVYGHSSAVRLFAAKVRAMSATDPIREVTIEFTKNRQADVDAGRFVDRHYGEVGYEWFHMLAVLRETLDPAAYRSFLQSAPSQVTQEIRVRTTGRGFPQVNLYASMNGLVGFPELAGHALTNARSRRHIARGHIPYGADLRYRFAHVELASGAQASLVFEPYHAAVADYKNVHVVRTVSRTGEKRTTDVLGNQLKHALLAQLEALTGAKGGTARIYLPEHRYMAALARRVAPRASQLPTQTLRNLDEVTA
ncbi:Gfo/Idh/MocA family oxidoreductase [Streptomyces sp. NPDC048258]|uniref:Gfo/Idh/MocA family oxidoreductase n=1 Tax=Streptomyces sp. NPDC048258 TaxID=3365527 RepID=UPI00371515F0